MKNFLLLRGEYDANNRKNLKNDTDMWVQLFAEMVGKEDRGYIWYKSSTDRIFHYTPNIWVITKSVNDLKQVDCVFARGGFDYYVPILKKCKKAFKIYYGAGSRMFPHDGIHYDMILVDCESDGKKAVEKYPNSKIVLWVKPCARHFKPVENEKKYDICFVAPNPKDKRKRVAWVYKTVPKDLRVLQLGNMPKIKVPKNVKVRRVPSLKMPAAYSKCKMLIAPYTEDDSAPRCIFEALACDVPVVARDTVKIDWKRSPHFLVRSKKEDFWKNVKEMIAVLNKKPMATCMCSPTTEAVYFDMDIYNLEHEADFLKEHIV